MPRAKIGDRVTVVRTGKYGLGDVIDGLTGTLVENTRSFYSDAYYVKLDTPRPPYAPSTALVESVELIEPEGPQPIPEYSPPTAAVGDRVTVLRQPRAEKIVGNHAGEIGVVRSISEPFRRGNEITHRYYDVRLDGGPLVRATKVATLPEPLDDWERELLYGTPAKIAPSSSHDHVHAAVAPAPPVLVDVKRVQSLMAAKEVLGEYAEADDLLRLAEYVENGSAVSTDDPDVDAIKRVIAAAKLSPVDTANDLLFTDIDGDELRVGRASTDGQSVCISTDADVSGVYLAADKVDEFVAFVLASKYATR